MAEQQRKKRPMSGAALINHQRRLAREAAETSVRSSLAREGRAAAAARQNRPEARLLAFAEEAQAAGSYYADCVGRMMGEFSRLKGAIQEPTAASIGLNLRNTLMTPVLSRCRPYVMPPVQSPESRLTLVEWMTRVVPKLALVRQQLAAAPAATSTSEEDTHHAA